MCDFWTYSVNWDVLIRQGDINVYSDCKEIFQNGCYSRTIGQNEKKI